MTGKTPGVGYRQPPVSGRFRKGQSGNPNGRPKKDQSLAKDVVAVFSVPVSATVNGKHITIPMAQAMFRSMCRKALKGDNAALRRVIDLMISLETAKRDKDYTAAHNWPFGSARKTLAYKLGLDPDTISDEPPKPTAESKKREKLLHSRVKEERKRLIREARRAGKI